MENAYAEKEMNLYLCWFRNEEWGCYVTAHSRGHAKSLFAQSCAYDLAMLGEFTDIRALKIKSASGFSEGVHDIQDETLDALGVNYLEEY